MDAGRSRGDLPMRRSAGPVLAALLLPVLLAIAGGPSPPLPPLNAKVEAFTRSHLGRPVGDGICVTLAVEALRDAGARGPSFDEPNGDYTWGDPVASIKDALPGDILQFRDAVFQGKRSLGRGRWTTWHDEYAHHTAVVAKVSADGKLVTIHHQNVARDGQAEDTKGNVQEWVLRMDSLQKGGWVRAYRPVPPDR